jgi:hypothetical protein
VKLPAIAAQALSKVFFQRVGIVGDAAAVRCVVHDRTQFQRLAKSGGYSRRGLRGRMGVQRILESSSYAIGPHIRRDPPRIPAAAGVGTKQRGRW